ncbi:hypothetical protein GTQ99_23660 [Kineococcus sp. T13]|nr:hypothetical protein [Kineococcus vitellinus]
MPTPTTAPPQEFSKVCLDPPPLPGSLLPGWGTEFTTATVVLSPDEPDRLPFWWELTPGQRAYADRVEQRATIDRGAVVTSPSTSPRIGQTIAFSVGDAQARTIGVGATRMRAVLESLTVDTGEGGPPVTCTGGGVPLEAGATRRTGPEICSFTYRRTSGGHSYDAPDTFEVTATERWRIEVSVDAGLTWDPERVVTLPVTTGLRVTEVQTLVVPLRPATPAP